MSTQTKTRRRMSADERREEIVTIAVSEFALKGLHGTSTETIAGRAGVSQPYLFRLFGTKKQLFLAAAERVFDSVFDLFTRVADSHPENKLQAMGFAYRDLLTRREELLMQMQLYAACSDPEIEAYARRRYGELWTLVQRLSGADDDQVRAFFATGMLLNVAAALNLSEIFEGEEWVRVCLAFQS